MSLDFMYEIVVRAVTKHIYIYLLPTRGAYENVQNCKKKPHKNQNLGKMLLFMRVRFSLNIEPANR